MAHQYKVGDKVRIIKREGKGDDYPSNFVDEQAHLMGRIFEIRDIQPENVSLMDKQCEYYNFEPVLESPELRRDTAKAQEPVDIMVSVCGFIGVTAVDEGGLYYIDFDTPANKLSHWGCCEKIGELVPDFRTIAYETGAAHCHLGVAFPLFDSTEKLLTFVRKINSLYDKPEETINPKTLNKDEIRFQNPKASVRRGSVPEGHQICGRKNKTAIVGGHLGYRVCAL